LNVDSERLNRILTLALPIIGGMVSQNLLNIVDTAMVGNLGNPTLAAVGLGGFVVFMYQALILGISTVVQSSAPVVKVKVVTTEMLPLSIQPCYWPWLSPRFSPPS